VSLQFLFLCFAFFFSLSALASAHSRFLGLLGVLFFRFEDEEGVAVRFHPLFFLFFSRLLFYLSANNITGYNDYQIYLLLSCAPVQGHVAGIVDIPNACTTMGLPMDIFDFDISPHLPAEKRDLGGQCMCTKRVKGLWGLGPRLAQCGRSLAVVVLF